MKMLLLSTMYMCIYDMLMFMGWFMCYATFDKYLLWQVRMRSTRKPDSAQAGLIWYLPLLFLSETPRRRDEPRLWGEEGQTTYRSRHFTLYVFPSLITLYTCFLYSLLSPCHAYMHQIMYIFFTFFSFKDIQLFDLHTVLKRICFYRKITRWYDSCQ